MPRPVLTWHGLVHHQRLPQNMSRPVLTWHGLAPIGRTDQSMTFVPDIKQSSLIAAAAGADGGSVAGSARKHLAPSAHKKRSKATQSGHSSGCWPQPAGALPWDFFGGGAGGDAAVVVVVVLLLLRRSILLRLYMLLQRGSARASSTAVKHVPLCADLAWLQRRDGLPGLPRQPRRGDRHRFTPARVSSKHASFCADSAAWLMPDRALQPGDQHRQRHQRQAGAGRRRLGPGGGARQLLQVGTAAQPAPASPGLLFSRARRPLQPALRPSLKTCLFLC